MPSAKGAPQFPSLMQNCVCWFTGQESNEFPIIPSGVTVTPNGTFTKTDLGNNKAVVNFDGSTNKITLANLLTTFDLSGTWTMCFWLNVINPQGYASVFYQGVDGNNWFCIRTGATNTFAIYSYISNSNKLAITTANNTYSTGEWNFYTLIKVGNGYTFYKNVTTSIGTGTQTAEPIVSTSAHVIGGDNGAGMQWLNGQLKDLMIFKGRALTAAEIKLLMARTHPTTGRGLLPGGYDYHRDV